MSLCERCRHLRTVVVPSGARYLLCQRHATDARFAKYPRQPVILCPGFEAAPNDPAASDRATLKEGSSE